MSTFTALNIEPESDSDDEIDNSKEIQIEEALKLYQNALKLHSQGPLFFDQAEEAYSALFRSEVFSYLESLSETQRIEYYGDSAGEIVASSEPATLEPSVPTASADGTPSTLPQILYLSYKNHGYFLLDRLKYSVQSPSQHDLGQPQTAREPKNIQEIIVSSLGLLVEALERDDSDVELWRQISKIGESLGSKRIARFCLEAILDRDGVEGDAWPEPLGLQELFARERLVFLLQRLEDDICQAAIPSLTRKQEGLIRSFERHLDPLPYLPTPPPEIQSKFPGHERLSETFNVCEISVPLRNWASCGKAILLQLQQETQGLVNSGPSTSYALALPPPAFATVPGSSENIGKMKAPMSAPVNATLKPEDLTKVVNDDESFNRQYKAPNGNQENPYDPVAVAEFLPETDPAKVMESAISPVQVAGATGQRPPDTSRRQSSVPFPDPQEINFTITLPTRKRSNDAELEDAEDTGRSRSKRIKARSSIEEPASRREAAAKQQLELYQQGELQYFTSLDEQAYEQSANILSALGCVATESVRDQRASVISLIRAQKDNPSGSQHVSINHDHKMANDFSLSLLHWDAETSNQFLHSGGLEDPINGTGTSQNSGLLVFLEQSGLHGGELTAEPIVVDDQGLDAFAQYVREKGLHLDQLALAWISVHLSRNDFINATNDNDSGTYECFLWPDSLKETIVQLLVKHDEFIFKTLSHDFIESHSQLEEGSRSSTHPHAQMIQSIFELHLDVYGRITNPSSEVDSPTRIAQLDRLRRWASLAYRAHIGMRDVEAEVQESGISSTRFLWAFAIFANLCDLCSRDAVILYFQDLKSTLEKLGSPILELRNNAVVPEISVAAADRQISRLMTMDFFISIFNPSNDDPVALIESLEPILEKSMLEKQPNILNTKLAESDSADLVATSEAIEERQKGPSYFDTDEPHVEQMLQFLNKASLSMRLMLWRRLIDAYSVIQYSPRILLCYMRCVTLIVSYLKSNQHLESNDDTRQRSLLRWFKSLDDLLTRSLALAWSDAQSLDCMDEANLREAMSTLTALRHMLHPVLVVDDSIKIGLCDAPEQKTNSANAAYNNSMMRLRDMLVRTWTLQYLLIRENASQFIPITAETYSNLFTCFTSIHRVFGPRNYCKLADKIFLKLARREILTIGQYCDSETEGAQIILDAYELKICPGSKEVEDHGCPAETLYRSDAVAIMDRVLTQAKKYNIKDLIKSDLRNALEKMQQAIRTPKNTATVLHNRRVFDKFLRSPVNPLDLYRAMQGIGELHFLKPHGESFLIAEKGWYFLQGYVALAKFRSQRRTNPGGADELDVALKFFQHDLEQGYEKWETWYRLAQVYDAKLEEATIWTAEKLNDNMEEVVSLQRSAIHCYTMAVATAERCAEPTFDMFQKIAELYSDFGIRMYGSSREPFSMEALSVEKFTKHFNAGRLGTYQGEPFKPISQYSVWRFAVGLLRRALTHKIDNWATPYMLGKCLWKMHNCSDHVLSNHRRIGFQPAIDAFKTAIDTVPERRDNKHPEKDPMLEPHYKLASVVHKLVSSRRLSAQAGCETLTATHYARRVPQVQDFDDWEGYILQVLKVLRSADKSNWHHRMVLRSARTIYEESPNDHMATLAAKHELTQQIFTKSMTVQVWKPENERAGRHFVYTTRYVEFFLGLLYGAKDRSGVEALGRQIRKKPGKFFRHGRLWHQLCMTHLDLLRSQCVLQEDLSDLVFKNISHEVFVQNADRLEAWAHQPKTESPVVDVLREAIELKKTNANLMKPTAIEDFIADAYAHLHQSIVPELIIRSNEEESRGRMRVDHLMNLENPPISTPSPGPAGNPEDAAPARQRIRGVGRRELQKRAESLVSKPASAQTTVKAPKTPPPTNSPTTPRSTVQVVIRKDSLVKENSSVPGSVHDSADDESEHSDIENIPDTAGPRSPKPLFPNLGDYNDAADEEEKEGSEEDAEQPEEEQLEDEGPEEDEQGDVEGEETYHTPMEM